MSCLVPQNIETHARGDLCKVMAYGRLNAGTIAAEIIVLSSSLPVLVHRRTVDALEGLRIDFDPILINRHAAIDTDAELTCLYPRQRRRYFLELSLSRITQRIHDLAIFELFGSFFGISFVTTPQVRSDAVEPRC